MQSKSMARVVLALLASGVAVASAPSWAQTVPEAAPLSVAAPATLSPEAMALRDAMTPELADLPAAEASAIGQFYASRNYAPFWTEAGIDRSLQLAAALDASEAQALPRARYGSPEALTAAPVATDPASVAKHEVAASHSYLLFATDLSAGVLTPSAVVADIDRRPAKPTPASLLAALETQPVSAALKGFEPQNADYARLVSEKARLEIIGRTDTWGPAVAEGPTLHPGDSDPRVAELRARLARLGYVVPAQEAVGSDFDDSLAASVEQFQRDYGLNDDGVVGAMTLAAVNAPIETRLAQVMVNLERLRWMNDDLGARYLLVNIPDFTVTLFEDGQPGWNSRVVVGKAQVTENSGVLGRHSHRRGEPDVAHPGLDRDP